LPREEVIRRLRALGQPVTLFGEEDADRQARLAKVEKTVALVDETRGGQQENVMLMLKRQEKAKAKQAAGDKAAAGGAGKAAGGRAAAAASGGGAGEGPSKAAEGGAAAADADAGQGSAAAGGGGDGDGLLDSFKAAAARVAEQRAEEALPVEDRMVKLIQGWCAEWEADLEARPEDVSEGQPVPVLVWHTTPTVNSHSLRSRGLVAAASQPCSCSREQSQGSSNCSLLHTKRLSAATMTRDGLLGVSYAA
jgi:pre-mRNA-splicing factor 18